jgi:hypothetical protein
LRRREPGRCFKQIAEVRLASAPDAVLGGIRSHQ